HAAHMPAPPLAVAAPRELDRIRIDLDHRARLLVEGGDARQAHLDQLDGGDLTSCEQAGEIGGGELGELGMRPHAAGSVFGAAYAKRCRQAAATRSSRRNPS